MEIKENVILAPYTTFRIGGPARYFCEVGSVEDLKSALRFSKENKLRFFVLGGGSNVLISDEGFNGIVIKMEIRGIEIKDNLLSAAAGEVWDYAVSRAVERNLGGMENLSLIPGTVGAAVCQNIGAYGAELKDILESVEALDTQSGEIKIFTNKNCRFEYRNSIFKRKEGDDLIILKVNLRLLKIPKLKINYPDLIGLFKKKQPSISDVREAIIKIRKDKLSYPDEIGNAGSFFKNPIVSEIQFKNLVSKHKDLKGFNLGNGSVKLFAAQLIEKCGWKGKRAGNVGVSEKHALVLVNYDNGTAEDLSCLEEDLIKDVEVKFGVKLAPEVEKIGGIAK